METTPADEEKKPDVSPDVPTGEYPVPPEPTPFSGQETVLNIPRHTEPAAPSEPAPIEESNPPSAAPDEQPFFRLPEEPSPAAPSDIPTGEYHVPPEQTSITGQETVLHIQRTKDPTPPDVLAAAEVPSAPSEAPEEQPIIPELEEPSPAAPSDIPTGEYPVPPEQELPLGQQTVVQAFSIPEPPPAEEAVAPAAEQMEEQTTFPPVGEPALERAYPTPEPVAARPYPLPPQQAQAFPYPPGPQPAYQPPYSAPNAARPPKDRTLAMILEALPGLFGFLGIGWLVAGNTVVGVVLLLGFLAWNFIALIIDILTVGFFTCLHIPANLVAVIISTIFLYNYTKKYPELFGS